jgi:hypothetical protein
MYIKNAGNFYGFGNFGESGKKSGENPPDFSFLEISNSGKKNTSPENFGWKNRFSPSNFFIRTFAFLGRKNPFFKILPYSL